MAVAWYGVKVWVLIAPDGITKSIATRPSHSWAWEMWTLDKRDGTTPTVQIPQKVRSKYRGYPMSMAYDQEWDGINDSTIPTVALLRVEYPDEGSPPIEAQDYNVLLETEAKWENAMTQYPTLKYRFLDQPYYPAIG